MQQTRLREYSLTQVKEYHMELLFVLALLVGGGVLTTVLFIIGRRKGWRRLR